MKGGSVRPLAIAALLAVSAVAGFMLIEDEQGVPDKPNLLFILTDDQRVDTLDRMPATRANFDVVFASAVVSTPLCCPARATFLTGQYAHNLGVWTNDGYPQFRPREPDSLGPWLQAQGYYTGFFGKYLNAFTASHSTPPGWDEFSGMVTNPDGSFVGDAYTNVTLRERFKSGNGSRVDRLTTYDDPGFYYTRFLLGQAVEFLGRAESQEFNPSGKPWALFVWPTAPHLPAIAEPRYAAAPVPAWTPPPSFLEADVSDKPPEVTGSINRRDDPALHEAWRALMLRTLPSVDDLVRDVFAEIDRRGLRERTWGLYASDNGFFWGEHRLAHKLLAYEESAVVPFRMSVPGIGPRQVTNPVSSIDVAPTFAALAGDAGSHGFRGVSLVPLLAGPPPSSWRKEQLIESRSPNGSYDALRTPHHTYVEWVGTGHRELYYRQADPHQLDNLAARYPELCAYFSGVLARLKAS